MKFRWLPSPDQPLLTGQLARQLQISPLLAQCLVNRRFDNPEGIGEFLDPRLKNLADPFLIPNMTQAVDRLLMARERRERVVIFGDYDVDGVTSTALMLEFLQAFGWDVDYHLPLRLAEGYGLTLESVERCLAKNAAKLLLALDCGSNAVSCITALREKDIDVIVVDHHQVAEPAPPALALVNPRVLPGTASTAPQTAQGSVAQEVVGAQLHESPPFGELCSVGLAFKLAHALLKRGRAAGLVGAQEYDLRPLLDLVALGTIADLVPLTGENRILVSAGLDRLNRTQRPGLVALKAVARSPLTLGSYEVGYQLAPRLNAAGRLETADDALKLLQAQTAQDAFRLAEGLDTQNRERRTLEQAIADQILESIRARFQPNEDFVLVEGHAQWHVGVVGIVASRVLHQFNRPTIIVGGEGDEWRGSGRSIAGFDLAAALGRCSDLLVRHGGHAMAAGLTLKPTNLGALRQRLNDLARRELKPEQFQPALRLDAEVSLKQVSFECLGHLDRLNPIGQGNPPVHLFALNVRHDRPLQRMGSQKQHVKMWVTDGVTTHEAVWWGAGDESLPVGQFDLAFSPQINHYNGARSIQLKVLDWRPSGPIPAGRVCTQTL